MNDESLDLTRKSNRIFKPSAKVQEIIEGNNIKCNNLSIAKLIVADRFSKNKTCKLLPTKKSLIPEPEHKLNNNESISKIIYDSNSQLFNCPYFKLKDNSNVKCDFKAKYKPHLYTHITQIHSNVLKKVSNGTNIKDCFHVNSDFYICNIGECLFETKRRQSIFKHIQRSHQTKVEKTLNVIHKKRGNSEQLHNKQHSSSHLNGTEFSFNRNNFNIPRVKYVSRKSLTGIKTSTNTRYPLAKFSSICCNNKTVGSCFDFSNSTTLNNIEDEMFSSSLSLSALPSWEKNVIIAEWEKENKILMNAETPNLSLNCMTSTLFLGGDVGRQQQPPSLHVIANKLNNTSVLGDFKRNSSSIAPISSNQLSSKNTPKLKDTSDLVECKKRRRLSDDILNKPFFKIFAPILLSRDPELDKMTEYILINNISNSDDIDKDELKDKNINNFTSPAIKFKRCRRSKSQSCHNQISSPSSHIVVKNRSPHSCELKKPQPSIVESPNFNFYISKCDETGSGKKISHLKLLENQECNFALKTLKVLHKTIPLQSPQSLQYLHNHENQHNNNDRSISSSPSSTLREKECFKCKSIIIIPQYDYFNNSNNNDIKYYESINIKLCIICCNLFHQNECFFGQFYRQIFKEKLRNAKNLATNICVNCRYCFICYKKYPPQFIWCRQCLKSFHKSCLNILPSSTIHSSKPGKRKKVDWTFLCWQCDKLSNSSSFISNSYSSHKVLLDHNYALKFLPATATNTFEEEESHKNDEEMEQFLLKFVPDQLKNSELAFLDLIGLENKNKLNNNDDDISTINDNNLPTHYTFEKYYHSIKNPGKMVEFTLDINTIYTAKIPNQIILQEYPFYLAFQTYKTRENDVSSLTFCINSQIFSNLFDKLQESILINVDINQLPIYLETPLQLYSLRNTEGLDILTFNIDSVWHAISEFVAQRLYYCRNDVDSIPPLNDVSISDLFGMTLQNYIPSELDGCCARIIPFHEIQITKITITSESNEIMPPFEHLLPAAPFANLQELKGSNLCKNLKKELLKQYFLTKRNYRLNLRCQKSSIHGLGLFTRKHFLKNELIIEYTGEIIRNSVANLREMKYSLDLSKNRPNNDYDDDIPCYFFRINKHFILDASTKGNLSRFINHSCEPNCYTKIIKISKKPKILFFASKDIGAGSELTCDYNISTEETIFANNNESWLKLNDVKLQKYSCLCHSRSCNKYMN